MPTKKRQELYTLFSTGSKPTHDDFIDLIDSAINIAEDGIGASEKGKPMEIIEQGVNRRLLDFSTAKDTPIWRISAESITGERSGFNISTANQKSRVFIDQNTGLTGINNDNPLAEIHITPESGDAVRVDDITKNAAFVISANGQVGVGTTNLGTAKLSVKGSTAFEGTVEIGSDVTVNGTATMAHGLTVQGAVLTAKKGITVQNGATVETGLLDAKNGITVSSGMLEAHAGAEISGAALMAHNGLSVTGGATIETGSLEVKNNANIEGKLNVKTDITAEGTLVTQNGLTANNGVVIETGLLTAKAGATIYGAELLVQNGATISGSALVAKNGITIKGGELVAQNGATISGAELVAQNGATIRGAELVAQNGATISGAELVAQNGATVSGAELVAQNGATISGDVHAQGTISLGETTIAQLNVTGKFSAASLEMQSLTTSNVISVSSTIENMHITKSCEIKGSFEANDGVILGNGKINISYDGAAGLSPVVTIQKGTVSTGPGHFNISIDNNKSIMIIYDDVSDISNFTTDWETYKTANTDKALGFTLDRKGSTSWKLRNTEIELFSKGIFKEFAISENALRIIFTGSQTKTPKFSIQASAISGSNAFDFEIANDVLTIKYPDDSIYRIASNLLTDWASWKEFNEEVSEYFEIRQTSGTGAEAVSAVPLSTLTENTAKNIFYKGIIRTNSVSLNNALGFAGSHVSISDISDNTALSENSDSILPTQKAVKSYTDTKADKAETETALNTKADKTDMAAKLAIKADITLMTTALATKADKTTVETALDTKADKTTMTTALNAKADLSDMTTKLAAKADSSAMTTALATKADKTTVETALDTKADKTTMTTALNAKADLSDMTTKLAAKADSSAMNTALVTKSDINKIASRTIVKNGTSTLTELTLSAESRGMLMFYIVKNDNTVVTGLFALHGNNGIAKISGNDMSNTLNGLSYNVYYTAGSLIVQNNTGYDIVAHCTYLGA
jgi:hypothetical protein